MAKISPNEILLLIHSYLIEQGLEKIAKKLEKAAGLDSTAQKAGIAGKKLKKICKFYLKHHPELRTEGNGEGLEEEETKVEEIAQNDEEIEEIPEEREEIEVKSEKEEGNGEEPEEEADTQQEAQRSGPYLSDSSKRIAKNKTFFQRVDHSRAESLKPELKDNSFMAKYKFGRGDEFGKLGHEKLKDTRGRGFKKEKGKLKNKNFQGGGFKIDIHARNSIKL